MCIDWEKAPEWIEAAGTWFTAGIAGYALYQWRTPLQRAKRHETANEILEQSRLLQYVFYDARNPFVDGAEFPTDYSNTAESTTVSKARAYAHMYSGRWNLVQPQIMVLAKLRARAGAIFNDAVADAIEELAREARMLHEYMRQNVDMIRDGNDLVEQYPDQQWVKVVRNAVKVDSTRSDDYSRKFEEKLAAVDKLLAPYK